MSTTTNPLTVSAPEGVQYVDFTREFDFPIAAVFNAYRDPALVARWLGPREYDMEIEEWDFRTGGRYRYVHSRDGESYAFNGVFHVVRENDFAVQTFEFEGYPDVIALESARFVDLGDGRTRVEGHSVYPTQEARDGMVASGMEHGMREGFERLDELLAS